MKEIKGRVFSIPSENRAVPDCTVSNPIHQKENTITYFSLGKGTDISAESYSHSTLYIVNRGNLRISSDEKQWILHENDCFISLSFRPYRMEGLSDCIYTEVGLKEEIMNQTIKGNAVFQLKDLVPYQEGKIVNMDIVNEEKMKFVIMSLDEGLALAEHAAPGEALVFALDGKAVIGYEGKDYEIEAGENFVFEKNGLHRVKAVTPFKMALLLVLE